MTAQRRGIMEDTDMNGGEDNAMEQRRGQRQGIMEDTDMNCGEDNARNDGEDNAME